MRNSVYISATGVITEKTPDDFLQFLNRIDKLGYTAGGVTFHSPGGNLFGGVTLGSLIREHKLHTRLEPRSQCSSACMIAFIGGRSRRVAQNARIGNHQLNIGSNHGVVQPLITFLSEYHKKMNVSPLALAAAMTRTADDMYWYSYQEIAEWGIVTKR